MRRVFEYALAIAILAIAASLFRPLAFFHRDKYREEVRGLYERLHPGMTRPQVQEAMESGRHPNLEFYRDDRQRWLASSPLEFGAQNWVLIIEFHGDQVAALRIRTADSFDQRSPDAPPDK